MSNTKEARALIAKLRCLQNEIFDSVIAKIDAMPNMVDVNNSGVRTATVSAKAIFANGGILSPEYYIQDVQKMEIKNELLKSGKDVDKMTEKIKEMIETKRIKGSTSDKTVMLNPISIKTLSAIYADLCDE